MEWNLKYDNCMKVPENGGPRLSTSSQPSREQRTTFVRTLKNLDCQERSYSDFHKKKQFYNSNNVPRFLQETANSKLRNADKYGDRQARIEELEKIKQKCPKIIKKNYYEEIDYMNTTGAYRVKNGNEFIRVDRLLNEEDKSRNIIGSPSGNFDACHRKDNSYNIKYED